MEVLTMADSSDTTLTLTPLAQRYIAERVRRGELQPITVRSFRNALAQFAETFGRRPIEQLGPRAIERHLEHVTRDDPEGCRVVAQGLYVGDQDVLLGLVLQSNARLQGSGVMADVERSRRPVAGEHDRPGRMR